MSSSVLISGGTVILEDGVLASGAVGIDGASITQVGEASTVLALGSARKIDATGMLVAPGLFDIQINGGFGHDFTDDASSIWAVGSRLVEFGVTAFVPTVVTSAAESRMRMLDVLASGPPGSYRGATPLGAHFEGPFISPDASGAHDPNFLRLPTRADPDRARWSPATGVRIVTLAPELEGAIELVRSLVGRGVVVSAGHSRADYSQAKAGFDAGITYATHLFNAMSALDHREPGLPGAALADERVTVGMIADEIHVHRAVVGVAASAAGRGRLSLVTDATAALGMAPGRYVLGGRDVVLDGSSVRLATDGRLAGSALTSDEVLRKFVAMTRWQPADAIASMTSVPARLLGLTDRGVIEVGRRADLTLLTPDLEVVATFVGGEQVYGE